MLPDECLKPSRHFDQIQAMFSFGVTTGSLQRYLYNLQCDKLFNHLVEYIHIDYENQGEFCVWQNWALEFRHSSSFTSYAICIIETILMPFGMKSIR